MPLDHTLQVRLMQSVRDAAKAEILPRFRNLDSSEIAAKTRPSDLVTAADVGAERMMTAEIGAYLPQAMVVGEEAISDDPTLRPKVGTGEMTVILDPVDGTWNFTKGLAVFGTILAVAEGDQPVFGGLYDPVAQDWVVAAKGEGAFYETDAGARRALQVSKETLPHLLTGFVPFDIMPKHHRNRVVEEMAAFASTKALRCCCHEYRLIASGKAEFIISHHIPNPWDHAAGVLAVVEAGGVARFMDGARYDVNRYHGYLIVASSEEVWQTVAARFAFLQDDAAACAS